MVVDLKRLQCRGAGHNSLVTSPGWDHESKSPTNVELYSMILTNADLVLGPGLQTRK
jgi:hypothetical protein